MLFINQLQKYKSVMSCTNRLAYANALNSVILTGGGQLLSALGKNSHLSLLYSFLQYFFRQIFNQKLNFTLSHVSTCISVCKKMPYLKAIL